ncbi:MAG TPA: hypothetical protein VJ183_00885 [Chloroflexia bacterium]|nr:hypothetical protein [Chloroflexia bacterium]
MTRERLRIVIGVSSVVILCLAGVLIILLLATPPRPPGPPLYPEPPTYAGATEIEIIKGDALERLPTIERERAIRFKTSDTPQAVLSFYEETLKKAGWSLFEKIAPDELNFYWTDGTAASGLYKANVTARPSSKEGTEVTIETGYDAGGR